MAWFDKESWNLFHDDGKMRSMWWMNHKQCLDCERIVMRSGCMSISGVKDLVVEDLYKSFGLIMPLWLLLCLVDVCCKTKITTFDCVVKCWQLLAYFQGVCKSVSSCVVEVFKIFVGWFAWYGDAYKAYRMFGSIL